MNETMKQHRSCFGVEALMNVMIKQQSFAFGVAP